MYQLRRKPRTSLSIIDMLTRDTLEASAYLAKPRSGSFRPYFAPAASLCLAIRLDGPKSQGATRLPGTGTENMNSKLYFSPSAGG